MGTKRKKKKRRGGGSGAGGGRTMSGLRGGFKGVVGQGQRRGKESTLSKLLTLILLVAAVGIFVYRFVL